jgi:cobalamin-dependent methionine synthase I
MLKDIPYDDFHKVYEGQCLNAEDTPVPKIALQAEALALFAITLGRAIHDEINTLLGSRELALGSMLDSVASAGAEQAADMVETRFLRSLINRGLVDEKSVVMRYSPGYCGWHVSGQKKLFEYLQPGKIGIDLNDSYLMEPLKSVSGVLIAGSKEIHFIEDNYPFCSECKTHSCQERMAALLDRA